MAVAFDTASDSTEFTAVGGTPKAWTHTPVGTPKGVVVLVTQVQTAADAMTGVTYGGVAMTRVPTNGFAQDTLVEAGAAWAYFLGSGIPTGPQTVSIAHDTGIFGTKHAVCVTITADRDTEVVASGMVQGDAANPSVSLDSSTKAALKLFGLFSGRDALANLTDPAGITRIGGGSASAKWSGDSCCRVYGYRTTPGTGSEAVGQTAGSDDAAMVALAVAEVAAPSSGTGPSFAGGGFF